MIRGMKKIVGVILAGGKSSRYKSSKYKYLDLYKGKEIICHIVESMLPVVEEFVIVVNPDCYEVKEVLKKYQNIRYVIQEKPLGTGHALLSTSALLENEDAIALMSFADTPMITTSTLFRLLKEHVVSMAEITISTTILSEPGSKGRIIRKNNKFVDVIEFKDADEKTRGIKEVNAGCLVCYTRSIYGRLRRLDNDNSAGEYYLTKVFREFVSDGLSIHTVPIPFSESHDINTVEQLDSINKCGFGNMGKITI